MRSRFGGTESISSPTVKVKWHVSCHRKKYRKFVFFFLSFCLIIEAASIHNVIPTAINKGRAESSSIEILEICEISYEN